MSGLTDDLQNTVDRLSADHCSGALRDGAEQGVWPAGLWRAIEETGLSRALLPEAAGGAGLDFADAMLVLRRSAWHALPVPLMESMLAARLLHAADISVPDGALSVAPVSDTDRLTLHKAGNGWTVTGRAQRVPWGDQAGHLLLVGDMDGQEMLGLLAGPAPVERVEKNLAGEARAQMRFDAQALTACVPLAGARQRLLREGALMRCVQMTGALEQTLELSLRYAKERVQFGRPIGAFQAVQHMLALLAGHVAAAGAACDAMVESSSAQADEFWVSAAKARIGEAAGKGAEIAHQVHGAMGFTHEHSLHRLTRRLWSWRDEFGNEAYWQERLGRSVAARGADALWPMLTG